MSSLSNVLLKRSGFTLDIPQLEILDEGLHLLQGPSGSGKSTLLQVLLGLTEAEGYSWTYKGENLQNKTTGERRIGIVFQNLGLFPHMTAKGNIEFVAEARGVEKSRTQKELSNWAEVLGMNSFLDKPVSILSGGEKQRVAFLRALLSDPRIIFLDEPFSNLDQKLKSEGRQILLDIKQRTKVPILMVSHDPEDAKILADKITLIENGRIRN